MDFEQAEKYIRSLLKFGIKLGLESINSFLLRLGYSWEGIRFIHVGGTNGKGSTAAMVAGILHCAGYRVGLYTSPHITSYRERIAVNGIHISEEEFAGIAGDLANIMLVLDDEEKLTEFEFLTVMALEHFRRSKVQIAVLEVGMGGRFDATNIVPTPEVSVITNVSRDHMQHLGNDILSIAGEKAGIIKAGGCLVTAEASPEIRELFKRKCWELDCAFHSVLEEVEMHQGEYVWQSDSVMQECTISGNLFSLYDLKLRMLGWHQIINGATALTACEVLVENGYHINNEHIRSGLESIIIPGRIEVLRTDPLVILDAAHNAAGIEALKETISALAGHAPLVLVTGMLDDKDRKAIVEIWGRMPSSVIVTRPDTDNARSSNWREPAGYFRKNVKNVQEIEGIEEAVAFGRYSAGEDGVLCVTGSFYVLQRARRILEKEER